MTKPKAPPHSKLHRTLHLQHHRHTGRRLSRQHTSYRGLAIVLGVSAVFVAGLTTLARTTADTLYLSGNLSVTAQIMAPIPSQAAVITDPLDNTTTGQAQYAVSGTCPVITPSVIIAILDNGVSAGSAPCDTDSTFSATISLVSGLNTLVARVYTITYQPGLDSTPVHLTYTPGSQGSTGGGTGGNPSGGGTDTNNDTLSGNTPIGTNSNGSDLGALVNGYAFTGTGSGSGVTGGEGSPLVIGMDKPFILFAPQLDAVWEGSISGGVPGYQVTIYWGDGAHTNYTLSSGGGQSFRHHYKIMQPQIIDMYVSDSSGQRVERQYAAVTSAASTASGGASSGTTSPAVGNNGLLSGMSAVGLYGAYVTLLAGFGALWARSHRQFAFAKATIRHHAKMQRRRR